MINNCSLAFYNTSFIFGFNLPRTEENTPPRPPFRSEPPPRDIYVTPNYYADVTRWSISTIWCYRKGFFNLLFQFICRTKNWSPPSLECAIKPASHTTERHSGQCPMSHSSQYNHQDSGCSLTTYHTPDSDKKGSSQQPCQQFREEMRNAPPAPPANFYRPMTDFKPWQSRIGVVSYTVLFNNIIIFYFNILFRLMKRKKS